MGLKLNLGMDRPDSGVAVATSVQKVNLINFADGFITLKFEDKKSLGLKLFQVWTNLTTVLLVEGKARKLCLKLRIDDLHFVRWYNNFLQRSAVFDLVRMRLEVQYLMTLCIRGVNLLFPFVISRSNSLL